MTAVDRIAGTGPVLLICDHASSAVPDDIDLRIAPEWLEKHIAIDIGAADLTRSLAGMLGAPALLARVSRLVIDFNRQPDHPGLIPVLSDGHPIPGNDDANRADRIARFHAPYHRALAAQIAEQSPRLIVAIHSFTPALESGSDPRPWAVGILYNRDIRAAHPAIDALRAAGVQTGDNQPYSGRQLNATLNRHGEANGIASFAVEVRNDLISDAGGVDRQAQLLAPIIADICNSLAQKGPSGT